MLKLFIVIIFLIPFINKWFIIQNFFLFISFLFLLICSHDFFIFNLGFNLGSDHISYLIILLRIWITSLITIARQKIKKTSDFQNQFILICFLLCFILILSFSSTDYLLFYIRFERALIPTLIIIIGWGYQPERIEAGIYILFYTLFASFPFLISLLYIYSVGGTLTINLSIKILSTDFLSFVLFSSSIIGFLVKLPVFIFHLWLPKAHVEAPVAGSIILAGVLLKLGGYGLIRIIPLFSKINSQFSWTWIRVSIFGGIIVRFICLRQVDIKSLIAYSSIAHIRLVLCGLLSINLWGLNGSVIIILGHGLCSSGLFFLVNTVYERLGRRRLLISKGLINFIPSITLWWFLLRIRNMAAPPSLNLLGEINLFIRIINWNKFNLIPILLISFFRASYTLYIFSLSQHGSFFRSLFSCCSGKVNEFLTLFLHWFPLNILIIKSIIIAPVL